MSEVPAAIVGLTEGNGHPFSFSAIINGYDEDGMARSGWEGIHAYVRRRDPSEFGVGRLRVTHAWTQDQEATARLCAACRIEHAAHTLEEVAEAVEVVIIARDDHENHVQFARPFLERGLRVFLDKPLALVPEDIATLRPYLESGQLMSGSGLRFAKELDEPRADLASWGELALVRGAVLFDWPRYGVHMVEGILGMLPSRPVAVTAHATKHLSVAVEMDDGTPVLIDALGAVPKTFRVDIFGSQRVSHHEIEDNFSMFRRMMCRFWEQIDTGRPAIPPERTLDVIRVLVAGQRAHEEKRRVTIDELGI